MKQWLQDKGYTMDLGWQSITTLDKYRLLKLKWFATNTNHIRDDVT